MSRDVDEGDEMAYEPCRYAKRWPDVWASLPDDAAQKRVSVNLASARLAGHERTRKGVRRLVDVQRGEISANDAVA